MAHDLPLRAVGDVWHLPADAPDDELAYVQKSDDDDDDVDKSAAGAAAPPQQAGGKPPVHPLPVETLEEKQRGAKRPLEPLPVCWCERPRKFYRHLSGI